MNIYYSNNDKKYYIELEYKKKNDLNKLSLKYDYFHSHHDYYYYNINEALKTNYKIFTILREPINLMISYLKFHFIKLNYKFFKGIKNELNNFNFNNIEHYNILFKHLPYLEDFLFKRFNNDNFEEVKNYINKFDYIGLYEDLNKTSNDIKEKYNLILNINKKINSNIDLNINNNIIEYLKTKNYKSIKLYKYCKYKFYNS